jgi:hypothetical protein
VAALPNTGTVSITIDAAGCRRVFAAAADVLQLVRDLVDAAPAMPPGARGELHRRAGELTATVVREFDAAAAAAGRPPHRRRVDVST